MSSSSAESAASWQHAAMVAPVNPSVCCASCSKLTSCASGMARVWTAKMAARPPTSGCGTGNNLRNVARQQRVASIQCQKWRATSLFFKQWPAKPPSIPTNAPWVTHLSKRPGRNKAGSKQSSRLVAAITITPFRVCKTLTQGVCAIYNMPLSSCMLHRLAFDLHAATLTTGSPCIPAAPTVSYVQTVHLLQ